LKTGSLPLGGACRSRHHQGVRGKTAGRLLGVGSGGSGSLEGGGGSLNNEEEKTMLRASNGSEKIFTGKKTGEPPD